MLPAYRTFSILFTSAILGGCASAYQLSGQAKAERADMTQPKAELVLQRFSRVNDDRGGICMIGIHIQTRQDPRSPVEVSGSRITVTGNFSRVGNVSVSGNVLGDTGQVGVGFTGTHGKVTVDTKKVKELRVLPIDTARKLTIYQSYCPQVKSGYLVVFKSINSLPDGAELSFNVSNQHGLDTVIAALSYLSPNAKLVEGAGM